MTKLHIEEVAIQEGFEDLMELTWFCHNPQKYGVNYEPCGVCHPCISAMNAGMGNRIPLRSKIRYYFSVRSRVKKLLRRFPSFFAFVRQQKENS